MPVGGGLSGQQQAVLLARYDPATGAIRRKWRDVAAMCGQYVEGVRMHEVYAMRILKRWSELADGGVLLAPGVLAALAQWRPVLTAGTYQGRYRAGRAR